MVQFIIYCPFQASDDDIKAVGTEANVSTDNADAKKPETPAGATWRPVINPQQVIPQQVVQVMHKVVQVMLPQGGGDAQKVLRRTGKRSHERWTYLICKNKLVQTQVLCPGDFEWKGAQWINTKTGKIADKATAAKLGNPKLAELAREIEKAGVGDLVKDRK